MGFVGHFIRSSLSHDLNIMQIEIDSIRRNKNWTMVQLPIDTKTIGCRQIFKTKDKSKSKIDTYKAQLVPKAMRKGRNQL